MTNSSSAANTCKTTPKAAPGKHSGTSKLDTLVALLRQPNGTTVADMSTVTGWQAHSVRGALAGSLKQKGHVICSEVAEGVRRYRIAQAQA